MVPGRYCPAQCRNRTLADCRLAGIGEASGTRGKWKMIGCPIPDENSFHAPICKSTPWTKRVIPRIDTALHGVATSTQLADCKLAGVRGASAAGSVKSQPRFITPSVYLQRFQHTDEKTRFQGRYRPAQVRKPQPHWLVADWPGFAEPAAPGEDGI